MSIVPGLDILELYDRFDAPVTEFDCGRKCAPHNPNGNPFCCDICHATPAAFHQEWSYLQAHTDLWHIWRGDECSHDPADPQALRLGTPDHMLLLACLGPAHCQRQYRALSCRQFPFFPYLDSAGSFLGLAYEWHFEDACWVISHLQEVTETFRNEFVRTYDSLLLNWRAEYQSYSNLSEEMRAHFAARRRRIPLLHRNGFAYLISPISERIRRIPVERLPSFGPYKA